MTSPARPEAARRHHRLGGRGLLITYAAMGVLAASGGARPTGLAGLDAVLLAATGIGLAACAHRARAIPVYVAAALAAALQPDTLPQLLGVLALLAAFSRRGRRGSAYAGALAGGLAWAATVGAGFQGGSRPIALPVLALAWVVWSARRNAGRRFKKRVDAVLAAVGGTLLACLALGATSVAGARADMDRGVRLLESGLDSARAGDTAEAEAELRKAQRALDRGQSTLGALWARPAWLVPGASQNLRALHIVVGDVANLAAVGVRGAREADLESLRVRGGRIDLAAVAAVEAPLEAVLQGLRQTDRDVERISAGWLLPPVRDRLDDLRAELADATPSAELALEGVRAAPSLLGADEPRTYLVLFTTPVESRGRTGFPGNYAEITFDDGRFERTRFGRLSELNAALGGQTPLEVADGYLARYGRFSPASEWRSVSFSPDFPTVADVAAQLYPRSSGRELDGVLSVDPTALAALLRFTGPVAVADIAEPLDADNAARFLLRDQYIDLPENPDRIDALEALADAAFERLERADLPGPRELGRLFGPLVEEGHLQTWAFEDEAGSFLHRVGLSGRMPDVEGDFVGLVSSNVAMNKIDLFLERRLDYEVAWDPSTGALDAVATVTLTNNAPAGGLPSYILDNAVGQNRPGGVDLPSGWNAVFLTLYTPWLPTDATIDGEPLLLEVLPELDRQAVSTFVQLAPGQSRTVRIELAGSLRQSRYLLDMLGQPMVTPDEASVEVRVAGGGEVDAAGPVEASGATAKGAFTLVRPVRIVVLG